MKHRNFIPRSHTVIESQFALGKTYRCCSVEQKYHAAWLNCLASQTNRTYIFIARKGFTKKYDFPYFGDSGFWFKETNDPIDLKSVISDDEF